jgi:hypothetical protein
MTNLNQLLGLATDAEPRVRIDFRDPIAAHGARAIEPLRGWLSDPRLGAFAVRTLEKIAADPANRRAVLDAFESLDRNSIPKQVSSDASDAMARLGGSAPRRHTGSKPTSRRAVEQWPGTRDVSALELRFHDDMLDIFRLAGEATRRQRQDGTMARGYWASYFLRGVRNHGGPEYAHQLLRKQGTSDGFRRLTEEGRLDLSVEALVLRHDYAPLFTEDERRIAAHRLAESGYQPAGR